ncbi:helix-turn-helix domain-containing protein [Lysinibacillus sphaericus]|uniref:helix-turn-helix domain-containing protein n=1 Tax=Lysinibacillus sphaericus TaxID=1421 RepID=UPI00068AC309|nr:helix-turn-helix transcriptional regulator [Lysinibacillus sphaericus]
MKLFPSIDYGKLLQKFRKNADMTQEEVADQLEMTQSHISKYELGRKVVDIETFMRWVQVTNSQAEAAFVLFGVDIVNTATQMMTTAPMFIGGMFNWIML